MTTPISTAPNLDAQPDAASEEVKRQRTYIEALERDVKYFKEAKENAEAQTHSDLAFRGKGRTARLDRESRATAGGRGEQNGKAKMSKLGEMSEDQQIFWIDRHNFIHGELAYQVDETAPHGSNGRIHGFHYWRCGNDVIKATVLTEGGVADSRPAAAPDALSARDCPTCNDNAEDCIFNAPDALAQANPQRELRDALWNILYWDQENVIPDEMHQRAKAAVESADAEDLGLKQQVVQLETYWEREKMDRERLEAQLADLKDFAYDRAPKLAAEELQRQKEAYEARLAEARNAKRIAEDLQLATAAELDEATAKLNAHRRFHGKAGCPGEEACYVCALDKNSAWPTT